MSKSLTITCRQSCIYTIIALYPNMETLIVICVLDENQNTHIRI